MGPSPSSPRHYAVLILFALLILWQRSKLADAPLHGDICAYAVIGHEMMHGRQLYSDLWERKPPLLYATFAGAELLVGYDRREIFLVGLSASLMSLILIYHIGRSAGGSVAGLAAAALWVLLNCDLDLAANQPDPEVFINTCLTAAFLLLIRWPARRQWLAAVLLGALFSVATLYKHNTAIVCVAMAGGHLLVPRSRRFLARFTECAIAGAVMVAVWSSLFLYFAVTGRAAIFFDVLFRQNASYSGDVLQNLAHATQFSHVFPAFTIWMLAPAAMLGVAAGSSFRGPQPQRRPGAHWFLLSAWAIGAWPTIAVTGYTFPHYYQLWLPIGCVAGGWATAVLLKSSRQVPPIIGYTTVIAAFACLLFRQGGEFLLTPEQWTRHQFAFFNLSEKNQLGIELGKLLKPNQQFYEFGADNALYFFSKHSPPTGLLFIDPFIYGDETQFYWNRLMRDLNRSKPDLVILSDDWTKFFPPDAPVYPWLTENYVRWNTRLGWPHYQMFVRRGVTMRYPQDSTPSQ